jgi:hypothetical protein
VHPVNADDEAPEVDALPVLAEPVTVEHQRPPAPVARQAAVVAATSFAAGLATVAVVRSHPLRRLRVGRRRRRDLGRVVASRTFLVDVHLLDSRK